MFQNETVEWSTSCIDNLSGTSFSAILKNNSTIEILLIGCGTGAKLIKTNLLVELKNAGIIVEPMDTGAACRTFNVLIAEDRRVAAALIPVA